MQTEAFAYKNKMTPIHYGVVLLCFVMNMFDGTDVMVISYTSNAICKQWQIIPSSFGIVFSMGLLGMAIGAMALAGIADRLGRKPMIVICLSIMGIGILATGISQNLYQLMLIRFLTGIGIGCMLAITSTLTAEYTTDHNKNFWVSFVMSGYPVGAVLSGLVANPIIAQFGWKSIFFLVGTITLLIIPFVVVLLQESLSFLLQKQPPHALHSVNAILHKMKLPLLDSLPVKASNKAKASVQHLFTADRKQITIPLWLSFLLSFAALYLLTSWIPKLASIMGLSPASSIYAGIFFNVGAFVGIVSQGYLSGVFGLKKTIAAFLIITGILMDLFGWIHSEGMVLLFFCLIGFFIQGGFVGLYAVAARVYGTEIRSTGIGWAIGFGRLGAILGPYIGGLLISNGATISFNFLLFAFPVYIAGILVLFIQSPSINKI